MKKIHLKPWRDLLQMKGRALLIIFIIGGGVAISVGEYMAIDTLLKTRDTYFRDLHLADLDVTVDPATDEELPPLDRIEGVRAMTRSLISYGSLELKDGRPLTAAIVYLDPSTPPAVNGLKITQGTYLSPDDAEGVVIERSLAEYHGYRIGDRITLNPYSFPREVTVRGIAISSAFLLPTSNPEALAPAKGSLGVVYASRGLVEEVFGYQLFNNFSFLFSPGSNVKSTEDRINRLFSPLNIRYFVRKTEQFSFIFLEQELKMVGTFIPATIVVFSLLAAIALALAVNRLVQSQLKEIGGLMALGYTPASILGSYLLIGLILGVAGGGAGLAGSFWICRYWTVTFTEIMGMPPAVYSYPASRLILGFVLGVLVALLSTALPLLRIVRLLPREALAGGTGPGFTFRRTFLSDTTLVSADTLFGLRNLVRRPGLTVSTILLMALAVSLSTAFVIMHGTIEHAVDDQFSREYWDAAVVFRTPLEGKDVLEIVSTPGVDRWQPIIQGVAALTVPGGESAYFSLMGIPARLEIRRLKFLSGRWFSGDDAREIVINTNFNTLPGVRVGDAITVTVKNTAYSFTVVGTVSDGTNGIVFAPIETVRRIMGLAGRTGGFYASSHLPPEGLRKALSAHEMVDRLVLITELKKLLYESMDQVRVIANMEVWISIFMAILFLLSSLTVNILERETEYATLGALGYGRPSLARIVLTEVMAEVACALALSIPLSVLIATYLNHELSRVWFRMDLFLNRTDILGVMAAAFLATPAASIPGLRTIFTLNLPEVLRTRAIG